MRERQIRKLLTEAEVFGLSWSGDGATVMKNPLINSISNGHHHPLDVHDIFDFAGHIEGWNTNNSNYISDSMKVMMDDIDPSKELFDLINFDGAKVVRVTVEILEVDNPNLTCMLFTLNGVNTCSSEKVNLDFVKNLIRVSKL